MKTRLTKALQAAILKKVLLPVEAAHRLLIEEALRGFADKLYAHEHGGAEALARQMPRGWVEYERQFVLQARPSPFSGESLPMSEIKPFPHNDVYLGCDLDHPLRGELDAIERTADEQCEFREQLFSKVRAIFARCRTVESMLEVWPEGERYLPSFTPAPTPLVDISLVRSLNDMLGLPPVSEAGKAIAKASQA